MSFLARMQYATQNSLSSRSPYGGLVHGTGLGGFAVDKGERWGAALAFGAAKGYYRERMVWGGQPADLWLGAALTLLGAGLNIFSGGSSSIAPHAERFGDAGMMSFLSSMAAAWGNKKAGRTVAVIESGRTAPGLPGGQNPILGGMAPAMGGAFLSDADIARFSSPRA